MGGPERAEIAHQRVLGGVLLILGIPGGRDVEVRREAVVARMVQAQGVANLVREYMRSGLEVSERRVFRQVPVDPDIARG